MSKQGDFAGYTYCQLCKEPHMHFVVNVDDHGYPSECRCAGCGGTWAPWPSIREFAERKRERQRRISHDWYVRNREKCIRRAAERKRRVRDEREDEYVWATCPTCGREFLKSSDRQRYCRKACQVGRRRIRHKDESGIEVPK